MTDSLPDGYWSVMMLYASYQEEGVDQWNERKFYSRETADSFMNIVAAGLYPAVKQAHLYEMRPIHRRGHYRAQ